MRLRNVQEEGQGVSEDGRVSPARPQQQAKV